MATTASPGCKASSSGKRPSPQARAPVRRYATVLALGLQAWQRMFACLIIPAVFYIVFTTFIPESPRYLVSVGR